MKGTWEVCHNEFQQLKTVYLVTTYVFFDDEKKVAEDLVESDRIWRKGSFAMFVKWAGTGMLEWATPTVALSLYNLQGDSSHEKEKDLTWMQAFP